jgi:hypothetical protein
VAAIFIPCSFPCSLFQGRFLQVGPRLRSNVPPAARPRKVQDTRSPLPPLVAAPDVRLMNAQDGLGHIDLAQGGHRTCDL